MRKLLLTVVLLAALGGAAGQTAQAIKKETQFDRAKRIVFATFPNSTQDAALRVVGCETGHKYTPWSYNSSGASGYFQVLTGNAGRVLYYKGQSLRIVAYYKIGKGYANKLFNGWYNAKVALFLSKGGTNWSEWVCKP